MELLHSRVVLDGLAFPEGIRWYGGNVWFSDIVDFTVARWNPATRKKIIVAELDDHPSGLGFLPDGKLLIVAMGQLRLLRLDDDGPVVHSDLKPLLSDDYHLNDMVVDGNGRAYIGAYDNGDHSGRLGKIVLVEPSGAYRIVAEDMAAPNGMAITADGKTLLANDVFDNKILAFTIAPDGSLTGRRVFADMGDASPDGLCVDAEGAAWVGVPFSGEFRRITTGGDVSHRISYEGRMGVAPMLGGPERRTLYLCTSRQVPLSELRPYMRSRQRLTGAHDLCQGAIECVEGIAVPGAGWP